MKKKVLWSIAFCLLLPRQYGQQIEDLAAKAAEYIQDFFKNQYSVSVAVTSLENQSSLTSAALERTYQLIYSRLPEFNNNQFFDFLIDFQNQAARFNLTKAYQLNFLIHLKFIQNKKKVGIGIVIFSRRLDKIVGIRYVESQVPEPEKTILDVKDYGFKNQGFAKQAELEAKSNLMDIAGAEISGTPFCFFFYPDEILIYKALEQGLEKTAALKLKWGSPFYPVLHCEGKLGLFHLGNSWVLTAGTNFSPQAKVLVLKESLPWQESDAVPFVPFNQVILNGKSYLAGSPYELGKNYFQDRLMFIPIQENILDRQAIYERKVPNFFSLCFSSGRELELVHLIDVSYQYLCYPSDFSAPIMQLPQKGSALAVLDNRWLAISDYTTGSDRLFFFKIDNAAPRLTYENPVNAEILFISPGLWRAKKGFWLYTQKAETDFTRFGLEFWSKGDE